MYSIPYRRPHVCVNNADSTVHVLLLRYTFASDETAIVIRELKRVAFQRFSVGSSVQRFLRVYA